MSSKGRKPDNDEHLLRKLLGDDEEPKTGKKTKSKAEDEPEDKPADPQPAPVALLLIDKSLCTVSHYAVINGGTYRCEEFSLCADPNKWEIRGEQLKLANFHAKIVGETITDDGVETQHVLTIAVHHPKRGQRFVKVPFTRFNSLDWLVTECGPQYIIQAGNGKRDQLRHAIQEMSGDEIPSSTVFQHTGWREVDGQWCYLHGGGAIAQKPQRIEVALDGSASCYWLPEIPNSAELRRAVRASLAILDGLVPDAIAFPLLATVYRAAIGTADYTLWFAGPTGVRKSELAALAQQHFGAEMNRGKLPGNWASSDNALEGLAFVVKDALLVIDDFAPAASAKDAQRQHRAAERLIRGQGNHAGRQRMRADTTLRPPKPPRGLILATGEDSPRGHSIVARLFVTEIDAKSVDLVKLSECQRDAAGGLYAAAMSGFAAWLAPQYAKVSSGLEQERIDLRDRFVGTLAHSRTPDIVANLLIGLRWLLHFAEDVGAIDQLRRKLLWNRGQAAIVATAERQGQFQRSVDPIERFPEMLAAILNSGRAHVAGEDGRAPSVPPSRQAWGWDGSNGSGKKIGWVTETELLLIPDATYAALCELAREQQETYPVGKDTLFYRLKDKGWILRCEKGHNTTKVTIDGARRRVAIVDPSLIVSKSGQSGQSGQYDEISEENAPIYRPDFANGTLHTGQRNGAIHRENETTAPTAPTAPTLAGRVSGERDRAERL